MTNQELINIHDALFTQVTPDQYNDCIKYFLDHELNHIIFNLTPDEKDQFFKMITEFPALLNTLFFLKGAPFTNFVMYGNEFYEALKDPHDGIDYTPSWIVAEYKEWLTATGRPFPEDRVVAENIDQTPLLAWQASQATE